METSLELAARSSTKARTVAVLAMTSGLTTPLIYVDVGALWGVDNPIIEVMRNNQRLRVVGFEPDRDECDRLRAANPNDIYLPVGVGDVDGSRPFYVTAFNACASFLEPDLDVFGDLPHRELFQVTSISAHPMRRMDSLIAEGALPQPDFMKIDAQGFELNVLKGLGDRIRDLLGIRLETQLRPIYKGQALFPEIYEWMRERGFILRDLRMTYPFQYEVVELEAYFSLDPKDAGSRFSALKIWELAHDIPPGRTITLRAGQIDWVSLPV